MLLFCKKINVEIGTHSVLTPTFIIEPLKGPDGFIPFGPLLLSTYIIRCFHATQHLPVLSKGKTSFQVVCRDLHVAVFLVQDFDHAVVPEGGEAEFSAAFQAEGNVFDVRGQTVG